MIADVGDFMKGHPHVGQVEQRQARELEACYATIEAQKKDLHIAKLRIEALQEQIIAHLEDPTPSEVKTNGD